MHVCVQIPGQVLGVEGAEALVRRVGDTADGEDPEVSPPDPGHLRPEASHLFFVTSVEIQ